MLFLDLRCESSGVKNTTRSIWFMTQFGLAWTLNHVSVISFSSYFAPLCENSLKMGRMTSVTLRRLGMEG